MHRSAPRAAYELAAAQVQTPADVVSLFWRLAHDRREYFKRVIDLGAADGRFALGGNYGSYVGVELDPSWTSAKGLPKHARIIQGCAFKHHGSGFDACIGNPPYVRHHDIESPWKEKTARRLGSALGVDLRLDGNLYLYFLALAFQKINSNGLVGFILPYEWTSRPSALSIRDAIQRNHWHVDVYRFKTPIFDRVLTTASITFIDRARCDGKWQYYDIDRSLKVVPVRHLTQKKRAPLPYSRRSPVWARRGISPGTQKVFVLSEGERVHLGLMRRDVVPAVTSLRGLPESCMTLSRSAFEKHFVQADRRCWLIKTASGRLNNALTRYTNAVPMRLRDTATCRNQDPWYAYEKVVPPPLLFHSCFVRRSPKVVENRVRAIPVGTAYGIYSELRLSWRLLGNYLRRYPFRDNVIPHARALRKVEVGQLNHVLCRWLKRTYG